MNTVALGLALGHQCWIHIHVLMMEPLVAGYVNGWLSRQKESERKKKEGRQGWKEDEHSPSIYFTIPTTLHKCPALRRKSEMQSLWVSICSFFRLTFVLAFSIKTFLFHCIYNHSVPVSSCPQHPCDHVYFFLPGLQKSSTSSQPSTSSGQSRKRKARDEPDFDVKKVASEWWV